MTQTQSICVYLLGPMRIERDGAPIRLPRRKVESLLAYLILHPEQHTRDRLATLLWGDSSDEQARHSLRTALATLRQQISPDLLLADRDRVQLNPAFPLWVDLRHLLALEDVADDAPSDALQAALVLWQGELLAAFYDDWIAAEREHYSTRLLELFLQWTHALRARSEYDRAIAVAQRVLEIDPANEHAHQHLMFCHVAAGNRPAALRQYELCVRALRDELDTEPLTETTALYQWIKQYDGQEGVSPGRITNLPIPLTSFVGRARETAEVKRLLGVRRDGQGVRLLTLLGAGGNGKTRLAIQVGTDLIDHFADGVWWVQLAGLNDGKHVARAVAGTLGVREGTGEPLSQTIANSVNDKEMLLLLDNCEHLSEACAALAADLLERCPNLHILATSREPLRVAGELLWQVPTFAVPDPAQLALLDLLLQYESLRLFVDRAALVQPDFALTLENAAAVAEICYRLEGIPLAIELAAARVNALSVEQIAAYLTSELGARFNLLTKGSRSLPTRHQTLRATIDWSYNLLDDAERRLFRQLAVFPGGCTLELLEEFVAATQPPHGPMTLDLLGQLVDKSLVIAERQGGQIRYRLLDTLRAYALEQYESVEALKRVQQQHANVFLRLATEIQPELVRAQQQVWLSRLDIECDNLRAALETWIGTGEGEKALTLAGALQRYWDTRGCHTEARDWLNGALRHRTGVEPAVVARALAAAGWLAYRQGDLVQAKQLNEEGLSLYQQAEEGQGIAHVLRQLGIIAMDQGDYPMSQRHLEQSLRIFREEKDEQGAALTLSNLGGLAWDQDRFADARTFHAESLRIYQKVNNPLNVAFETLALGDAERMLDNPVAAHAHYQECLRVAQAIGHKGLVAATYKSMGLLASKQGEYEQARTYGEQALATFREMGDKIQAGFALASLGDVARKTGEYAAALSYYGQYLQAMHEVGYKATTFYALEHVAGVLAAAEQHPAPAARLMGAAGVLRRETGIAIAPYEQERYQNASSTLRRLLGDAAFDQEWQAGELTPLDQVVADATGLTLA